VTFHGLGAGLAVMLVAEQMQDAVDCDVRPVSLECLTLLRGFARDDRSADHDIAEVPWLQPVNGIRPGEREHIRRAEASTIALVERGALGFSDDSYSKLSADLGPERGLDPIAELGGAWNRLET